MPRSRFAVLVPYQDHIMDPCERQLRLVEREGVDVVRMPNCSEIGLCRSQLLSLAMLDGREAVLFVDSDMTFRVEDAIAILKRPEPIVAGCYSQKRFGKLNVCFLDDETVRMGTTGGDRLARHVGAGFLRITADACAKIIEHHSLPCCTAGEGSTPIWPFFLQKIVKDEESGEFRYLGEDFAFCERAREAGIDVIVDTRIRLLHWGIWPYGWEEALGLKIERLDSVEI